MFETLPGFREFYPEDCYIRNFLFEGWRETARLFGFLEFDAPVLEPLELFTQKSGNEIVEQLFAFEDRGGRKVALRPETTPSLARLVAAKANSLKKPIKWFNITENFRYERPQKGRLRSFYQFNADILGEASYKADAELLALAVESFCRFGLTTEDFYIRLSDRHLWTLFLNKWGFASDVEIRKFLEIFDKWERRTGDDTKKDVFALFNDTAKAQRFLEEVEMLRSSSTLEDIQKVLEPKGSSIQRLEEWRKLLAEVAALGYDKYVKIDLGIVRGLAYYTGFVFEVFEKASDGRALAGGGRYDTLLQKLCGVDMPAVGFAAGDVTLREILTKKDKLKAPIHTSDCFVVADEFVLGEALKDVKRLRKMGYSVEYFLSEASVSKQLKKAFQSSTRWVIFYGQDELKNDRVQVKEPLKGTSEWVLREELLSYLKKG